MSDHDLMFSQEAEPEENMVEDDQHSSSDYIQNRVGLVLIQTKVNIHCIQNRVGLVLIQTRVNIHCI